MQTRLAESTQTSAQARRQTLFDELHRKMLDDVPIIVLFNNTDSVGMRKSLTGYKSWAAAKPRLWNVK